MKGSEVRGSHGDLRFGENGDIGGLYDGSGQRETQSVSQRTLRAQLKLQGMNLVCG